MEDFLIEKIDELDSTNDYLMRELEKGTVSKDKVLIAKAQTNGHGMGEKTFVSEKDVGIYFTLLHFYKSESELEFITQKTAVAVYNCFKEAFDKELKIKWVNDLYYRDKKVCGILCRNLIKHKAVIIGVGIDLYKNDNLDDELKDIVGYIFENDEKVIDETNQIVMYIVNEIYSLIKVKGLPKLYIEKNIVKDSRVYEDFDLER